MNITITLGDLVIPGRLPFFPTRMRLIQAHNDALGLQYDPEAEDWVRNEAGEPIMDLDIDRQGLALAACLGACWVASEEHPAPYAASFHQHGYDADRFGDEVMTALWARGVDMDTMIAAGNAVYNAIADSVPTREARRDAADPTVDPEGTSTAGS